MKKTLSIILAILMIVTSVPFAFAAETDFKITHQPTVDEFYVEANDPNATYQWYEAKSSYEIDDTCASSCDSTGYYDVETGWTPSFSYNPQFKIYVMKFFKIEFYDYEKCKISLFGCVCGNYQTPP